MNFDDKLLYGFWLIIQREFKGLSDPAITKHLPFLFAYLYLLIKLLGILTSTLTYLICVPKDAKLVTLNPVASKMVNVYSCILNSTPL